MAEQGSAAWRSARLGSLTASRMADAVSRLKTGYGASRANLMATLLVERLTGAPVDSFQSVAMQWGTECEPAARAAYEFYRDVSVVECGFIPHPTLAESGASPDGLVGDDGLLEIKCPNTATHIDTLLTGKIDARYIKQMQWQMACTGRAWCDHVSFDLRLPEQLRFWCQRVMRDDAQIAELQAEAEKFLDELRAKHRALLDLTTKSVPQRHPLPSGPDDAAAGHQQGAMQ